MGLKKQRCADVFEKYDPLKTFEFDPENEDQLSTLYKRQRQFLNRFITDQEIERLSPVQRWNKCLYYIFHVCHELHELAEWTPFKDWKKYPDNFKLDKEEILGEIVDAQCFLFNIALIFGFSSDQYFRGMYAKQSLNIERQEDPQHGYVQKKSHIEKTKKRTSKKKK